MWIYANPNPENKQVPDCVIRAICIALNMPWLQVSDEQATEAVKTEPVDLSSFVTKEEFNELKALITKQSKTNQNGSKTRGDVE